jgi:hypothetical protein
MTTKKATFAIIVRKLNGAAIRTGSTMLVAPVEYSEGMIAASK